MPSFSTPLLFAVAIVVVLSICSCGQKKEVVNSPAPDSPTIVDVMVARPQIISDTVETNGTVVANEFAVLHPEVSGRITYLDVPEGKFIAKGTIIARINDADLEAQVEKSKVLLDFAQKTADRYAKLIAVNGINQSDYDAALNTVAGYKADIVYTQALIDKTIIRAPFDGVAGLRLVSPGAYVSPADVIASMQNIEKLKVDFTIPQEYADIIQKGNMVDVESDNGAVAKIAKAEIVAVEPQVNQSSHNIKIRAMLSGGSLNPGTFVKVYVVKHSGGGSGIMVPTNAVIPEDINNQLVLVKNGKATVAEVQMGTRMANSVEITKGISAGDTIVVTGVLFAKPNTPVTIRKVL